MELGAKIFGHDHHFIFFKFFRADLCYETKKVGFSMFFCVPRALTSEKDEGID